MVAQNRPSSVGAEWSVNGSEQWRQGEGRTHRARDPDRFPILAVRRKPSRCYPTSVLRLLAGEPPRDEHLRGASSIQQRAYIMHRSIERVFTSVVGGSPNRRLRPNNEGNLLMSPSIRASISGVRWERGRSMRQPAPHKEVQRNDPHSASGGGAGERFTSGNRDVCRVTPVVERAHPFERVGRLEPLRVREVAPRELQRRVRRVSNRKSGVRREND
jgi:hypothetical protein